MKLNASKARQKAYEGYISNYENHYADVDKKLNKADDLLKYIPFAGLNAVSKFREQTNQPPPTLPKTVKLNQLFNETSDQDRSTGDVLINDENQKVNFKFISDYITYYKLFKLFYYCLFYRKLKVVQFPLAILHTLLIYIMINVVKNAQFVDWKYFLPNNYIWKNK